MTYIVAELGANWRGDLEVLSRMVKRCYYAGVNAVKFQSLSSDLISRHKEWEWYTRASVGSSNIQQVDKICKDHGIEWFATPCYPDVVDVLNPYVSKFKIRSADNTNVELISKCTDTGKPVYISVARVPELKMAGDTHYIYCIPKYPTDFGELNFDMISVLKGYSNHCLDPLACLKAVRYGAEYLEFHLTDNRDDFAIDNKVSLSYSQMEEMMKWIK